MSARQRFFETIGILVVASVLIAALSGMTIDMAQFVARCNNGILAYSVL